MEVAGPIEVQVDPDRDSAGPAAQDGIDVAIGGEAARMGREQRVVGFGGVLHRVRTVERNFFRLRTTVTERIRSTPGGSW